jgi:hypothetical protein
VVLKASEKKKRYGAPQHARNKQTLQPNAGLPACSVGTGGGTDYHGTATGPDEAKNG